MFQKKPAQTEPEPAVSLLGETPKKYALFLDLETTGLDPENDRITEICVLRAVFGESVHDGLGTLINPGRPIPQRVAELTGITDEMVTDKPGEEVLHKFFDYIGADHVHAYNADFDMGFLRAAAKRLGRSFNNESRCVLELLREKHPNLRSYKLEDACAAFGINPDGKAHRAQGDTIRAIALWDAVRTKKQPDAGYLRHFYVDNGDDDEECEVYGHFNMAGECFYVRTVRVGQSAIPDKDPIWTFYTEQMLAGKYDLRLLDDELTYKKARAFKEKLLKKHAKTVLNRANPWRKHNAKTQEKYRALKDQIDSLINSGKLVEKVNPDDALEAYRQALKLGEEQLDLLLENSLFGEVDRAYGKIHRCNPLVKAVDRITMVLCRNKRHDEAVATANDLFNRYPGTNSLSGAEKIRNRISKRLGKGSSRQQDWIHTDGHNRSSRIA
ncbi:3'-5' exonuclease [Propionivibrio limicola]|uniref:3'-5' exonuclease n=1 Tax=Propionivibrio limicola TaxID=167645 RepID=UPI0012927871|nr:3'-5' exonuclease [Propionivibrio limicola]